MIIPVKCFTCGNVLADKYRYYKQEVRKLKYQENMEIEKVRYLTTVDLNNSKVDKTPEGVVLDSLGLGKYCCRRHMLTHVDLE